MSVSEFDTKMVRLIAMELEAKGLQFEGLFGSRARGTSDEESDYDILYLETPRFRSQFIGWDRIRAVEEIKKEIEDKYQIQIDLVSKMTLGELGKKYILGDLNGKLLTRYLLQRRILR